MSYARREPKLNAAGFTNVVDTAGDRRPPTRPRTAWSPTRDPTPGLAYPLSTSRSR